jgi:hypothetical protein
MKLPLKWFAIPVFALGLGACKKEEKPVDYQSSGSTEKAAAPLAEVKPAPVVPSATPEERAAKLGFARYLPKSVETVISVQNGKQTADRAKSLKFWKFIEDEMGEEAAVEMVPDEAVIEMPADEVAQDAAQDAVEDAAMAADPTEGPAETTRNTDPEADVAEAVAEAADAQPVQPLAVEGDGEAVVEVPPGAAETGAFTPTDLLGSEVTLALGETSGEQTAHVLDLYGRYNYFQIRGFTKMFLAEAKAGEEEETTEFNPFSQEMVAEMMRDPEGGIGLIEKLAFPPIYLALKADPAKRDEAAQQIAASLGFAGSFGDFAQAIEVEKAGQKFAGYKILGTKLAEQFAAVRQEMEQQFDAETLDRFSAALAKRDLVILSGTIGDYVVLFIGGSIDQFDLVTEPKDSLVATDALKFTDSYLKKDLAALVYGKKESIKLLTESASGLSDMAMGIRDGISGDATVGDTREIESLLDVVVEREAAMRKLAKFDDFGTVAFYEEGLKIESFGGADQGALDWKTPAKLGHLGDDPGVVVFTDMVGNELYSKASLELVESIFETGYALTRKVSELPGADEDLAKFKEMSKLFDEKFRGDAAVLWQAFSGDFAAGLGQEGALVIDLKGTVPAVPGLPQEVVDQGRMPRISLVAPVVDRSKLASAWDQMNKSGTSILAKVSEMAGQEIPMQKPMSSEKNGLTTWFFPMPFFNDDFMPSVTLDDKWFIVSTSKVQAVDLAAKAAQGVDGARGLVMKVNFVALQNYSKEMLNVVDENAQVIFGDNVEEYLSNKVTIKKIIESLDDFDSLSVHSNRDGEVVRTSIHFKTR